MTRHIKSQHCTDSGILDLVCPLCKDHVKAPANIGAIHFARHMEEIALGVLPSNTEVEDDSETASSQSEAEEAVAFEVLPSNTEVDDASKSASSRSEAEEEAVQAVSFGIGSHSGFKTWRCRECGCDNPDWHYEQCPICGAPPPAF